MLIILVTRKMQINHNEKATYSLQWLKKKKKTEKSFGEEIEKLESSYIVGGNMKWYITLEKFVRFLKSYT